MKIPVKTCDRVALCDWLLGYPTEAPPNWRFKNWNHSKRRLGSPLAWVLGEVSRFSLDRVWNLDIRDAAETDPRQVFLKSFESQNKLHQLVQVALERGYVTGASYFLLRPHLDNYKVYMFDEQEVTPMPAGEGYFIQFVKPKGYGRWGVTASQFLEFPDARNANSEWGVPKATDHGYGVAPMVETLHGIADHSHLPRCEFDWVSLELALEICAQTLGSAANYQYFGGPFLVSGDPKQTALELMDRRQVLTGRVSPDFQETGILQMPAMPSEHKDFVQHLRSNFADYHKISLIPETPPGDTSSLTMRILYARTISRAQEITDTYLRDGIQRVYSLVLRMAGVDGRLGYKDFALDLGFEHEVFALTPQDKQQTLLVVEQLVTLGVSPAEALKEYWPGLTEDEISQKIMGA